MIGQEVGLSSWYDVTQERIDRFAEATGDFQYIHTDPERALREGPFGGTIAHGFLLLSMLSTMAFEALHDIEGTKMKVNVGFQNVRFLTPVLAGKRIRGRFELATFNDRPSGIIEINYNATVEIEDITRPALTAEWLTLAMPDRTRRPA
jgi:acyl dehydratase